MQTNIMHLASKRAYHLAQLLLVAGALLSSLPASEAETMVSSAADSRRIVSLGGAITEILYALDIGDHLVGVDTTSRWPPAVNAIPKVGYQSSLSAEGIIAIDPTLVIGTDAAGPDNVLDQIRNAGIMVIQLPEPRSPKAITQRIRDVARIVGREAQGRNLAKDLSRKIELIRERVASFNHRPTTLFLFSAGRGTPLASGRGTAADTMIRLAGGINAIKEYEGYKPLNPEALLAAAPEVLLLTKRTHDYMNGIEGLKRQPGLKHTPAVRNGRVIAMDALYLLGFGPRTGSALTELADHLHTDG